MPATELICPDGNRIRMEECLKSCRMSSRCMLLPTLRAVVKSANRELDGLSTTQLIGGTRENFILKSRAFAIDPQKSIYALHGSAIHAVNEAHTDDLLSEIRLQGESASGMFDVYGPNLLGTGENVLGDYKVTSSYKAMRALRYAPVSVATGEFFKSGPRKGTEKTKIEWQCGGPRGILEWAIQINYYRVLLETSGFPVDRLCIQIMVRDSGLKIAATRHIDRPIHLIEVHRISDHWVRLYMAEKSRRLMHALDTGEMPPVCSARERWGDRKCIGGYCNAAEFCDHAIALKQKEAA